MTTDQKIRKIRVVLRNDSKSFREFLEFVREARATGADTRENFINHIDRKYKELCE